ncbi:MAG: hypothetical protein DRP71_14145 [Verrucomicrobia bacterium]|nr:MAG: hypothetical protein DRP71_14145 [Verrucomicrobiota bacterium]
MDAVRNFLLGIFERMGEFVPSLIGAILVLAIGWFLISLLKMGLRRMLGAIELNKRLRLDPTKGLDLEVMVSVIVYYLLLFFLIILALDILKVEGGLDPVTQMAATLFNSLPNILAAGLIGFLGYILGRIISSVVTGVTGGLDKFSPKLGLSEDFRISRLLGQIVFIFVFVPMLIAAFDALQIKVISEPASAMLQTVMDWIPNVLGALIILAVAWILGRFITNMLTEFLTNLGANDLPEKAGFSGFFGEKVTFSRFIGGLVFFFILVSAAMSAFEKLGLLNVSFHLGELIRLVGQISLGLVIIGLGNFLATIAYKALAASPNGEPMATIVRFAILGLVLAMGLRSMGIADDIVNLAFAFTLGAVAVAVALAFGLGGREAAGKQMEYILKKFRKEK